MLFRYYNITWILMLNVQIYLFPPPCLFFHPASILLLIVQIYPFLNHSTLFLLAFLHSTSILLQSTLMKRHFCSPSRQQKVRTKWKSHIHAHNPSHPSPSLPQYSNHVCINTINQLFLELHQYIFVITKPHIWSDIIQWQTKTAAKSKQGALCFFFFAFRQISKGILLNKFDRVWLMPTLAKDKKKKINTKKKHHEVIKVSFALSMQQIAHYKDRANQK